MRISISFGLLIATISSFCGPAHALPDLWNTVGFPTPTNVPVYRDHEDPNLYFVLPNALEVVPSDGNLMFSMQHRGVTAPDVDGVGGLVNFTATASFKNDIFMEQIWKPYLKDHPDAKLSVLPGEKHYVEFFLQPEISNASSLLSPLPDADPSKPVSLTVQPDSEATVSATSDQPSKLAVTIVKTPGATEGMDAAPPGNPFAFQASLSRLGARTLAFTDENYTAIDRPLAMIVRYQYVYKGIGPRYKIKISVNWSRLYNYYQKNSSSSKWFGISKSSDTVITKNLKDNSVISYEILDGALSPSQADEAAGSELFKLLSTARVEGSGMFKPAFQESNPGAGGSSSGFLGWGSSSRSFEERLNQNLTTEFIIERKETEERLHKIGFSIGVFCEQHPELYVNLTESSKRCISDKDMERFRKASNQCRENDKTIATVKQKYFDGMITRQKYNEFIATAIDECLVLKDKY